MISNMHVPDLKVDWFTKEFHPSFLCEWVAFGYLMHQICKANRGKTQSHVAQIVTELYLVKSDPLAWNLVIDRIANDLEAQLSLICSSSRAKPINDVGKKYCEMLYL